MYKGSKLWQHTNPIWILYPRFIKRKLSIEKYTSISVSHREVGAVRTQNKHLGINPIVIFAAENSSTVFDLLLCSRSFVYSSHNIVSVVPSGSSICHRSITDTTCTLCVPSWSVVADEANSSLKQQKEMDRLSSLFSSVAPSNIALMGPLSGGSLANGSGIHPASRRATSSTADVASLDGPNFLRSSIRL